MTLETFKAKATSNTDNSQTQSLRVLMVAIRFFPFMGGLETHTYEVARRLVQSGVSVTVVTANPKGEMPAQEIIEGITVQRIAAWPEYRDLSIAPGLFKLIANGNWDVVHCQGYHTLFPPLAMLAAKRAGVPYVLSFHSGGHSSRLRNAIRSTQRSLLRPLLAGAVRLVAVSEFEAAFFGKKLRLPQEKFVVIPNGAKLPELDEPVSLNQNEKLLVSVGRLERYKGHHRLIEALPQILQQHPNTRIRIVGSGPYEGELLQLAQQLGVAERVEIGSIPPQDRQGMARTLAQADVVTLLSDYEAHPVAVMEALAMQRPVLVSYTSGLKELADKGLVRAVVPESSPEEIARAILNQLRQPLTPSLFELPTWENCSSALLELYRNVAGLSVQAKLV